MSENSNWWIVFLSLGNFALPIKLWNPVIVHAYVMWKLRLLQLWMIRRSSAIGQLYGICCIWDLYRVTTLTGLICYERRLATPKASIKLFRFLSNSLLTITLAYNLLFWVESQIGTDDKARLLIFPKAPIFSISELNPNSPCWMDWLTTWIDY